MAARVLVVGAGRMALRHVAALVTLADELVVVDPREDARAAALDCGPGVTALASLDDVDFEGIDAAVLSATAAGRLERVRAIAPHVRELFLEKPLEQSRAATRALVETVEEHGARAVCHHWLRLLPVADDLRGNGNVHLAVEGGAYGLACNGVHWIDLMRYASGCDGELLWAELDEEPIASGRGPAFRDYGGRALFAFGGSRLFLASDPASPAPMVAVATTATAAFSIDIQFRHLRRYDRDPASTRPLYHYGADYTPADAPAAVSPAPEPVAAAWLRGVLAGAPATRLPTLRESLVVHELLFDLLETGGEREFPIT